MNSGYPVVGRRLAVCYICGREFGNASLPIHEKQCIKKFQDAEALKPVGQQRPLPQRPELEEGASLETQNNAALALHASQVMVPCPGCARTFKDEITVMRHQKGCAGCASLGSAGGRQLPPGMAGATIVNERHYDDMSAVSKTGAGPKVASCYICGREFGQASIEIHEKQCAKKFEDIEAAKPVKERRVLPQKPDFQEGASLDTQNDAALAVHRSQVMVSCPGCGRTFKDDMTMMRHQKGCGACATVGIACGSHPPTEVEIASPGKKPVAPKFAVCYICGREFGQSSIAIHEKQCAKKFEDLEAAKPVKERKALPQRPTLDDGASLETQNNAALAVHASQVMVPCLGCARTFKDETTMIRHQKGCAAYAALGISGGRHLPPDMELVAAMNQKQYDAMLAPPGKRAVGPKLAVCYICGREFGLSSIAIHEKQCAKKFGDAEAAKPVRERKALPQRADPEEGASLDSRNQCALSVYEAQVMAACPGCARTFKDETTLLRHQKGCAACAGIGVSGGRQLPPDMELIAAANQKQYEAMLTSPRKRSLAPKFVVCHLCGREFGQASISIHEKQCAKKFEDIEAAKPLVERKPLPERPNVSEGVSLEVRNQEALSLYNAAVKAPCPRCSRTFKDEATMLRHMKGCKVIPPAREDDNDRQEDTLSAN